MLTRQRKATEPGTAFGRYARCLAMAKGNVLGAAEIAHQYVDQPQIAAALIEKAGVPGMTSDTSSAIADFGVDDGLADLLSQRCAFDMAVPLMRQVPFNLRVPREEDAGTAGAWVRPGAALPAVTFAFDQVVHGPLTVGALVVLSDAVIRHGDGARIVSRSLLGALARTLDNFLLHPSAAGAGPIPPSLTYGAPMAAGSASWNDIAALVGQIQTEGTGLAWVGRPAVLAGLAAVLGGSQGLSATGVPLIAAPYAPAGMLALIDFGAVTVSVGDIDVMVSEQSAIEMESGPSGDVAVGSPVAPVPTSLVSLWQNDATGLRVTRVVNWTARPGCAVYYMLPTASGSPA